MMHISLRPIDETNREAVLALSVREDQPFVASNDVSLRQAAETNQEHPGVARPFVAVMNTGVGTGIPGMKLPK